MTRLGTQNTTSVSSPPEKLNAVFSHFIVSVRHPPSHYQCIPILTNHSRRMAHRHPNPHHPRHPTIRPPTFLTPLLNNIPPKSTLCSVHMCDVYPHGGTSPSPFPFESLLYIRFLGLCVHQFKQHIEHLTGSHRYDNHVRLLTLSPISLCPPHPKLPPKYKY